MEEICALHVTAKKLWHDVGYMSFTGHRKRNMKGTWRSLFLTSMEIDGRHVGSPQFHLASFLLGLLLPPGSGSALLCCVSLPRDLPSKPVDVVCVFQCDIHAVCGMFELDL